jgi:hypothetical protein
MRVRPAWLAGDAVGDQQEGSGEQGSWGRQFFQAVLNERDNDPAKSEADLLRLWEARRDDPDENFRYWLLACVVAVFGRADARPLLRKSAQEGIGAAARSMVNRALLVSRAKSARRLFALCSSAVPAPPARAGDAVHALELIDHYGVALPNVGGDIDLFTTFLLAELHLHAAEYSAPEEPVAAVTHSLNAALAYGEAGLRLHAILSIHMAASLIGNGPLAPRAACEAIKTAARIRLLIEDHLGSQGILACQTLLSAASGVDRMEVDTRVLRDQVMKNWSLALAKPPASRNEIPDLVRWINGVIPSIDATPAADGDVDLDTLVGTLLVDAPGAEPPDSSGPALQRYLDLALNARRRQADFFPIVRLNHLRPRSAPSMSYLVPHGRTLQEIQAMLGPRTVVLSYVARPDEQGRLYLDDMAITCDEVYFGYVQWQDYQYLTEGSRDGAFVPGLAPEIAKLRQLVNKNPGFRPVSQLADGVLANLSTGLLKGVLPHLQRWHAAGKDHLCIWPTGPLHHVPFPILRFGDPDVLIADRWTVTTIVSLEQLDRYQAQASPPGRQALVMGCDHAGEPFGLPATENLTAQAARIAKSWGTTPVTEAAATPEFILAELAGSRVAHIATHGSAAEPAPAFQCLYLTPGQGDGRLFAYQFADRRFDGLEVVTLAACETALGRFDLADTSRGLVGMLFAAGVKCIVGTLWQVQEAPARIFFETFHASLAAGKDKLDAFRVAQLAVRAEHPEYRDWGAFTLVGNWRNPEPAQERRWMDVNLDVNLPRSPQWHILPVPGEERWQDLRREAPK